MAELLESEESDSNNTVVAEPTRSPSPFQDQENQEYYDTATITLAQLLDSEESNYENTNGVQQSEGCSSVQESLPGARLFPIPNIPIRGRRGRDILIATPREMLPPGFNISSPTEHYMENLLNPVIDLTTEEDSPTGQRLVIATPREFLPPGFHIYSPT